MNFFVFQGSGGAKYFLLRRGDTQAEFGESPKALKFAWSLQARANLCRRAACLKFGWTRKVSRGGGGLYNSAGAAIPFCAAIPFDAAGCTAGGNVGEFLVPLGVQLSPSVEDFRGGGRKKSLSMPHEAVMRNVAQFARGTLEHRPSRVGTRPEIRRFYG